MSAAVPPIVAALIVLAFWAGITLERVMSRNYWRDHRYCLNCNRLDCEREHP